MCKSIYFNYLQNEMLNKAIELKLPENVINSIGYCICIGDLEYISKITDSLEFKKWFNQLI